VPDVIAIVGPTGVGKSTHVRLLAVRLRKKGHKVTTTQLKTGHLVADVLMRILGKLLAKHRSDVLPIGAMYEERPALFGRIFRLWMMLEIVSISAKFFFRIYLPKMIGHQVLIEDYIPATVSDHIFLCHGLGISRERIAFFSDLMLRLMKLAGPPQLIFLDANTPELGARRRKRGGWDELAVYSDMQRSLLRDISEKLSSDRYMYVDTTNMSEDDVLDAVIERLSANDGVNV
jgi:thymidylate kinase